LLKIGSQPIAQPIRPINRRLPSTTAASSSHHHPGWRLPAARPPARDPPPPVTPPFLTQCVSSPQLPVTSPPPVRPRLAGGATVPPRLHRQPSRRRSSGSPQPPLFYGPGTIGAPSPSTPNPETLTLNRHRLPQPTSHPSGEDLPGGGDFSRARKDREEGRRRW
jgi:hypothetical protein